MVAAGSLSALSRAIGRRSDDVAVLEAMLVVEENPVTRALDADVCWEFVNSGVDFVFAGGVLTSIGVRLVYDRTSSFNGVVVPSWLVAGWHRRPGPEEMRAQFGDSMAAGETEPETVRLPEWEALGDPSPRTRPGTRWEVFELDTGMIHVDYDASGAARILTLMAEPG